MDAGRSVARRPNRLGMAAQFAGNIIRVGWYTAVHRYADRMAAREPGAKPDISLTRPVPEFRELLADIVGLARRDAAAVARGLYPPQEMVSESPGAHLARLRGMLEDMPEASRCADDAQRA